MESSGARSSAHEHCAVRDGQSLERLRAVNDDLRALDCDHPMEIESGGIHQREPWFAGRLDLAPTLAYAAQGLLWPIAPGVEAEPDKESI